MQDVQARAARAIAGVLAGRSLTAELVVALAAAPRLEPADRGQLQDLCYGTLRFLGELRTIASALLDRPITEPMLQALVWVALYQLRHTRAAPYAVVDGAVETCPALGSPRARGLVNAVLRGALRRVAEMDVIARSSDGARYSYPPWWIARLRRDYPEHWQSVLEVGNTHPPFTVRVNRRCTTVQAFIAACAERGIEARPLTSIAVGPPTAAAGEPAGPLVTAQALDHCVRLARAQPVESLPGFAEGWFSVQDAGAQLAAPLLAPRDGDHVLDACAAPGGKTTHLLELADIDLVALDSDRVRLARVESNLARLGLDTLLQAGPGSAEAAAGPGRRTTLRAVDAAHVAAWWDGRAFERILLDAPCSGSGVVRRHPDIKWLRREDDLARFAAQQGRLLDALWPLLAPGGRLLYCTCSVFAAENDQVLARFLTDQPSARRVSCTLQANRSAGDQGAGPVGDPDSDSDSVLRLLPDADHDGFYYALLTKH